MSTAVESRKQRIKVIRCTDCVAASVIAMRCRI